MTVLVACEESQTVCKAFREMGHSAFSCDLKSCSGGHPEWHITGDVLPLINKEVTPARSAALSSYYLILTTKFGKIEGAKPKKVA